MNGLRFFASGALVAFALTMMPPEGGFRLSEAFAKSEKGGGNGGGGGHSSGHGKAEKSGGAAGEGPGHGAEHHKPEKADREAGRKGRTYGLSSAGKTHSGLKPVFADRKEPTLNARLAGLHSLRRNYRAYINAQDPRFASLRAFVLASANLDIATDDEALRQALLDAANKNRLAEYGGHYVDDEVMEWAKDVLGVGERFGKIDQVQDATQ